MGTHVMTDSLWASLGAGLVLLEAAVAIAAAAGRRLRHRTPPG
jgi:hypothetical protein